MNTDISINNIKLTTELERYAKTMNDNFNLIQYGLSQFDYYNMIQFFNYVIIMGDIGAINYSKYLLTITEESKKGKISEKLEEYANYMNDCIENNFENFSESKYNEYLYDIKYIILNKSDYYNSIVEYAEYLFKNKKISTHIRKYKLTKINNINESNN